MSTYILHIETAPLPLEELVKKAPEFKASAVLKDPVKIADDIEKKKKKYFDEARFYEATGYVCAYILWDVERGASDGAECDNPADEKALLVELYDKFSAGVGASVVTFGGSKYSLPYICRRAVQYGEMDFFHLFYDGWAGEPKKRHMDLAQKWACLDDHLPDTIKEITSVIGINYTPSETPYYQLSAEDKTNRLVDELDTLFAVWSLLK